MYHTSDITKFQTLQRVKASPTLSRVLFYCGIDVSRNRFKHFMQSEHRDEVGSVFDVTRITWLYRTILSEARKSFKIYILFQESMQKIQLNT